MASWFSQPRQRYNHHDDSPKRRDRSPSFKPYQHRRRHRTLGLQRSRIVSWCFCLLVFLAIVFWPKRHDEELTRPRPRRERASRRPSDSEPRRDDPPRKKQRSVPGTASHAYRSDGLLDVNPKGKHPILELIEHSETQWTRKAERQSKTFVQAVQEYKQRYGRAPPKGFEVWWDYADFHNVQLIDEYDSIHARLEPFWGVDPRSLRALQSEWETHNHTFTIGKVDGAHLALLADTMNGSRLGMERVQHQLDMLEDVEDWLPDFRATFTMHDGPAQFTSWELKRRAEEAAAKGQYLDVDRVASSINVRGWAAACPPKSPIHSYSPTAPTTTSAKKTFIYNHRLAMDPCLHPSHLSLNGFLSQYNNPNPHRKLVPTFSICVSPLHSDILTVAAEQYEDEVNDDPTWDDKPDERLLWRGSNTGILHQPGNAWNISHRIRLVEMSTRRGGTLRVLVPRDMEDAPVGYGDEVKTSLLNPSFMDIAFVKKPIQCRGAVCDELQRMFEWRTHQNWQAAWQYKYIMDVDGNGWSARFKRLMTSNSLIFKSTIFPEWYTERIMPWVHYIPIQVDLSDLYDTLMFFRGDLSGAGSHDDLARKIASAGKKWSDNFYRREDMTAYHFRLFLEYARVMSEDREAMSYHDLDIVDDDE